MDPLMIRAATPGAAVAMGIMAASRGESVVARGMATREVRYSTIEIEQPWRIPFVIPGRNQNQAIGALEALSLVGQVSIPEILTMEIPAFGQFTDDGLFYGAYGTRIASQLGDVVRVLQDDPFSRQAVLTIFDSGRDLGRKTKDMPCTIAVQFMIREEDRPLLEMRVMMRSNDAWLGLTYDVVQFAALQGAIAAALGVEMGRYVHQAGSLHLYEKHMEAADLIGLPDEDDDQPYQPMFHGSTIAEISQWCRLALLQKVSWEKATAFEKWLDEKGKP